MNGIRLSARSHELDSSYLEAAKAVLESLASGVASSNSYVQLTSEEIEAYLEFDPAFAEDARAILSSAFGVWTICALV